MRLVVAEGELLERVLDSTYPVWHDGLTRRAYSQWNAAQLRTPWGRERLTRFRPDRRRRGPAVVAQTLPLRRAHRRTTRDGCAASARCSRRPSTGARGHAAALIERVVEGAREEGALVAGLFSEIGEAVLRAPRVREGADGRGHGQHHAEGRCAGDAGARRHRARLRRHLRDARHAHGGSALRVETRSGGAALRACRRSGSSPGSARRARARWSSSSPRRAPQQRPTWCCRRTSTAGRWRRQATGTRLAPASAGCCRCWPRASRPARPRSSAPGGRGRFPVPPQISLSRRTDPKDIFMLRSLGAWVCELRADDVFYWRSDYF